MVGRPGHHLGRLPAIYRPAACSSTPRNLWNLLGADLVRRRDGDRHGADHRHPQHRPVGRLDARLLRHDHGRHAGEDPAAISRLRAPGHLDHHARPAAFVVGAAIGALQGSIIAFLNVPVLHRHARRPARLARRHLVRHQRPDGRADERHLPPDGRRHRGLDRRDLRAGSSASSPVSPSSRDPQLAASSASASAFRCRPVWAGILPRSRWAACSCSARSAIANSYSWPINIARSYADANGIAWPEGGLHDLARHRHSGADRDRRRHRHDLHRHPPALRPLRLRASAATRKPPNSPASRPAGSPSRSSR